ncbi:hexulose-6-phosphate synthase [Desulfovibrio sp. ZJ369]|uniref:hexulose-6-phosphate synthase n=1 Tax=Desulfovibrio sp. ZJ369 TaxID=2709793 RepID=UPI001F15233B|nr:hexulose-6-phosphate synthase [Desulfovibrio sp. ZJ369]
MTGKHQKTLKQIFQRPANANVRWADIENLFTALGAEISEAEGHAYVCAFLMIAEFSTAHILHQ